MSFSELDHSAFRRNSFLGLLLCIVICSSGLLHANESQDAKRWLDFMQQGSHAQLIQDLKRASKKDFLINPHSPRSF